MLNRVTPKRYEATTVQDMGWKSTKNGKLLDAAEGMFDILLTADKGIPFQQNLAGRKISMVVIRPKWVKMKYVEPMFDKIIFAIENVLPGKALIVIGDQP